MVAGPPKGARCHGYLANPYDERVTMSVSLTKGRTARVLSSVTPARYAAPSRAPSAYRDSAAGEFVSAVAGPVEYAGGTFGATSARYVVGGYADSVVLRRAATRAERVSAALEFVRGIPLDEWQGVGFWQDSLGRVWLDVVRGFDTLNGAKGAARENGELAIWDSVAGAEIAIAPSPISAWHYGAERPA